MVLPEFFLFPFPIKINYLQDANNSIGARYLQWAKPEINSKNGFINKINILELDIITLLIKIVSQYNDSLSPGEQFHEQTILPFLPPPIFLYCLSMYISFPRLL